MRCLSRFPVLCIGFAALVLLGLSSCQEVSYLDGTPPPNAKLVVSDVVIDTLGDSLVGRTIRVRFNSAWEIDSVEFSKHRFVFGMEYNRYDPQWRPTPHAVPIQQAQGSRADTLTCQGSVCYWDRPVAHVLMLLPNGQYLSVADDTLDRTKKVAP